MVHHERGRIFKEPSQHGAGIGRKLYLIQSCPHEFYPAVTSRLIDDKRRMPHSQSWMSTLLDVSHGTAKSANEKLSQPPLGIGQVPAVVHRPQNLIGRHPPIEGGNEPCETFIADEVEDFGIEQVHWTYYTRLSRSFHRR